ncbi:MAG: response regulator transcription factor [Gemmataceae bacterium]|nr:response regulator transcription factor [Gemmataceae bacterium]
MAESIQPWNLLLVEDDILLSEELAKFLRHAGHTVIESSTGSTAVQLALRDDFDAIILDLVLPEISGLEVLSLLRKSKTTPVIMISSMTEVDYRLSALKSGVDDFMIKPISHQEVLERLRAILRRSNPNESEILRIRNVEIDLGAKSVQVEGNMVHLTPTEFALLALLAKNQGRILSREVLQNSVFGADRQEYGNIIDQYIMRLRRKLGKDLITTKSRLGFIIYV